VALLDATMASLREANARLNAITNFYEDAPPPADGPFHGVPYVIKQLMADCGGHPTTLGSKFFATTPVAAADSAAVARMRRAGLVIVGRTNTSEGIHSASQAGGRGVVVHTHGFYSACGRSNSFQIVANSQRFGVFIYKKRATRWYIGRRVVSLNIGVGV